MEKVTGNRSAWKVDVYLGTNATTGEVIVENLTCGSQERSEGRQREIKMDGNVSKVGVVMMEKRLQGKAGGGRTCSGSEECRSANTFCFFLE